MRGRWEVSLPIALVILFSFSACGAQDRKGNARSIANYESCIAAGGSILKSMPPQCVAPDGRVFARGKLSPRIGEPLRIATPETGNRACRNLCGNGKCDEVVCMAAKDCPCAENRDSCPADCQ